MISKFKYQSLKSRVDWLNKFLKVIKAVYLNFSNVLLAIV